MSHTALAAGLFPVNICPPSVMLPTDFIEFLRPLHEEFTPWQERCAGIRKSWRLRAATDPCIHRVSHKVHLEEWSCNVPEWAQDHRNQMTVPSDDASMVVKAINSGSPSVMVDLEDSMANYWPNTERGVDNAVLALHGELTYEDAKRGGTVGIKPEAGKCVVYTRVRGLHMQQHGVFKSPMSASLLDLALLVWKLDPARLKHPICVYIPKSELAEEACWWNAVFAALEKAKGLPDGYIRCMALVESHTMAYQMEEFMYYLKERILGLNFGRWDYIASTLDYNIHDPSWVLCDRNTLPLTAPFVQNLRKLIPKICHKRKALAIGGMTALFPSRIDAELNARALLALETDKQNEAACGYDGAWTGHPDQNDIAVAQFPFPNQMHRLLEEVERYPVLRPSPAGLGPITIEGTRAAARTCILYRAGVLDGKGASLLNGFMEDLATDRIYRNMIEQRILHGYHAVEEVEQLMSDMVVYELLEDPKLNPNPPVTGHKYVDAYVATIRMIKSSTRDPS